jgi:acetyl esterase/lipase
MKGKNMKKIILLSVSCLAFATLCSCNTTTPKTSEEATSQDSFELPTKENGSDIGNAVVGTYKSALFDTKIGTRECFQIVLDAENKAVLSLIGEDGSANAFMGPYSGTYWHENSIVHLLSLTNPDGKMSKAPDLWTDSIYCEGDFGYATAILDDATSFHFKALAASSTSSDTSASDSGMPVEGDYTEWKDVVYGSNSKLTLNGKMKNGPGSKPLLITIPGGAFKFVDASAHAGLRTYFADQNYVAFTVTYTVGNASYPQNIIDVKEAIQYLLDNKDEYHIDPDNINVLGCSAGGYLAAMAALSGPSDFLASGKSAYTYKINNLTTFFAASQWMVSPFSDSGSATEAAMLGYSSISEVPAATLASCNPTTYLPTTSLNKVWISHGDADTTIKPAMSEAFYEKVKAALGEKVVHYEVVSGAKHEDPLFYSEANLAKVVSWNAILKEEIGGSQYAYEESFTITTPGGEMTMTNRYLLTLLEGGVCAFRNAENATCFSGTYVLEGTALTVTGLKDSTGKAPAEGSSQGAVDFISNGGFKATLDEAAKSFTPEALPTSSSSAA